MNLAEKTASELLALQDKREASAEAIADAFLGGAFARLVRTMELAVFVYVLSRGTLLLFRW